MERYSPKTRFFRSGILPPGGFSVRPFYMGSWTVSPVIMMGKREAYQAKMQAQLDQLSAKIDEMAAKGREMKADAQIEYYKQMDELKQKRSEAQMKFDELKKSGADAWEELKYGMDSAFTELQVAIDRAAAKFK